MYRLKRLLSLVFISIFILTITSCTSKDKNENKSNKEVLDTKTLIENIKTYNEKEKKEASIDIEEKEDKEVKKEEIVEDKKEKEKIQTIKLKAFGDIITHMGQITYAKNKGNGDFDFSDQFFYMKDFISDADISIGNFEASINEKLDYQAYPKFIVPKSLLKDIKNAGFDIVTTGNNHAFDGGEEGIFATIKEIEEAGLLHVGTNKDLEEKILFTKVKDIKLAFLSYTYDISHREESKNDVEKLVNFLDYEKIKKDIKLAKNKGADFIIVYPHWGREYDTNPTEDQEILGRNMIDWGADLVIGNHTHVVSRMEKYIGPKNEGYIFYSLGNFISLQSLEVSNDIRTEQSLALEFTLAKNLTSGKTFIENYKTYPLWVGTIHNDYGANTQTYLAKDFLQDGKYSNLIDENQRNRIKQAYDSVNMQIKIDEEKEEE